MRRLARFTYNLCLYGETAAVVDFAHEIPHRPRAIHQTPDENGGPGDMHKSTDHSLPSELVALAEILFATLLGMAWGFFGALLLIAVSLLEHPLTMPVVLTSAGFITVTALIFASWLTKRYVDLVLLTLLIGFFALLFFSFIFIIAMGITFGPNG